MLKQRDKFNDAIASSKKARIAKVAAPSFVVPHIPVEIAKGIYESIPINLATSDDEIVKLVNRLPPAKLLRIIFGLAMGDNIRQQASKEVTKRIRALTDQNNLSNVLVTELELPIGFACLDRDVAPKTKIRVYIAKDIPLDIVIEGGRPISEELLLYPFVGLFWAYPPFPYTGDDDIDRMEPLYKWLRIMQDVAYEMWSMNIDDNKLANEIQKAAMLCTQIQALQIPAKERLSFFSSKSPLKSIGSGTYHEVFTLPNLTVTNEDGAKLPAVLRLPTLTLSDEVKTDYYRDMFTYGVSRYIRAKSGKKWPEIPVPIYAPNQIVALVYASGYGVVKQICMVMELIDTSLYEYIYRHGNSIDVELLGRIKKEIKLALRGALIIHGDLSESNIRLRTKSGNKTDIYPVIIDFDFGVTPSEEVLKSIQADLGIMIPQEAFAEIDGFTRCAPPRDLVKEYGKKDKETAFLDTHNQYQLRSSMLFKSSERKYITSPNVRGGRVAYPLKMMRPNMRMALSHSGCQGTDEALNKAYPNQAYRDVVNLAAKYAPITRLLDKNDQFVKPKYGCNATNLFLLHNSERHLVFAYFNVVLAKAKNPHLWWQPWLTWPAQHPYKCQNMIPLEVLKIQEEAILTGPQFLLTNKTNVDEIREYLKSAIYQLELIGFRIDPKHVVNAVGILPIKNGIQFYLVDPGAKIQLDRAKHAEPFASFLSLAGISVLPSSVFYDSSDASDRRHMTESMAAVDSILRVV